MDVVDQIHRRLSSGVWGVGLWVFAVQGVFFFKLLNPRSDNGFLCFRASGAQLGVLRLSPGVRVEIFRLPNLLNPNTHDTPEPIGDLGVVPAFRRRVHRSLFGGLLA